MIKVGPSLHASFLPDITDIDISLAAPALDIDISLAAPALDKVETSVINKVFINTK